MQAAGLRLWNESYPDRALVEEDISRSTLYLAFEEQGPVAAFVLDNAAVSEYKEGFWNYPADSAIIVHRLCVEPSRQSQGIGSQVMASLESIARNELRARSIRLDTSIHNRSALKLYDKLGYMQTGSYVNFRGPFILYEKPLLELS